MLASTCVLVSRYAYCIGLGLGSSRVSDSVLLELLSSKMLVPPPGRRTRTMCHEYRLSSGWVVNTYTYAIGLSAHVSYISDDHDLSKAGHQPLT